MDNLKIVSLFPFSPASQALLCSVAQREISCVADPDEFLSVVHEAQIICSHWLPDQWRTIAPRLCWLQSSFAGVEALPATLLAAESGIVVTTASGIHSIAMSEYIFSSMLMFNRSWPELVSLQKQHLWPTQEYWSCFKTRELRGQTIGIIGLGNVGRRTAQLGRAFGMRVLATRLRFQANVQDPDVDQLYSRDRLIDMLRYCDYVAVTVPLTSKTVNMLGEEELRAMQSHTYLVNVSRGRVIDEDALICALKEGWIAGAGLDVTAIEPLPIHSPLYTLPNVILTPHISGETIHYDSYLADLFAENIRAYQRGLPLRNTYSCELEY